MIVDPGGAGGKVGAGSHSIARVDMEDRRCASAWRNHVYGDMLPSYDKAS